MKLKSVKENFTQNASLMLKKCGKNKYLYVNIGYLSIKSNFYEKIFDKLEKTELLCTPKRKMLT